MKEDDEFWFLKLSKILNLGAFRLTQNHIGWSLEVLFKSLQHTYSKVIKNLQKARGTYLTPKSHYFRK